MNRLKFPLVFMVISILVLSPSYRVQAQDGTENTNSSETLNQDAQQQASSDPAAPNAPAATPRLFLPMMLIGQNTSIGSPSGSISYYVSPSGSDSNTGTLNNPWRTIQKAANTLVAGQSVKILPGTYYEKFAPVNSGTSGAYILYTADPGTVVLDGSGVAMSTDSKGDGLVQILGKSYIKVENLTLRNASVNCVNISNNSSGTAAAFIEINGLTIQNCNKVGIRARFANNLVFKNNQINHINYSSGIGVWWSSDVLVDHNTITNAHYYHECQGAYDEALTISASSRFEVRYNTLDNTEAKPAGFCTGSEKLGIDIKESSQNGLVHHNTVNNMNAAGIYVDGWHAGANGTATLNHIDIYQNTTSNGGGITIGCEQADGVVEYINIYNNLVLNASFAGIQVRGAWGDGLRKNITIYNNTIYGALPAGGNGGAGIYVTTAHLGSNNGDAAVIIRNNISMFYFLSSGGGSVGQIRAGSAAIAAFIAADHNIVFGPQSCSTEFPSCVEVGGRVSANAVSVFNNPGGFDLHLKTGSPAIDNGIAVNLVLTDFDGSLRPQPAGTAYDIGAYEYK